MLFCLYKQYRRIFLEKIENALLSYLLKIKDKVDEYRIQGRKSFNDEEYEETKKEYLRLLEIWQEDHKEDYKKRKITAYYESEKRLIARLKEYVDDHLRFTTDFRIDFTNNLAERGLRKIKSKLNVVGSFRSLQYAKYYCDTISIIDTCKKQNVKIFEAKKYFYGKKKGVDIRTKGSGNSGATNTLRTFGWKAGLVTCLGDILKTVAAVLAVKLIFGRTYTEDIILLELYAGFGAVLGHNFPFYLKFKGGKGVACTGGMVLAVFPIVAPVSMGLFLVISAVTKYVSLGSIIGLISVFVQVVIYGQLGIITVPTGIRAEFYIVTACFTILGVWQHRANIRRLANGTENKIGAKKKEQK